MIRVWLALLLALSLSPPAASASASVPSGGPDEINVGDADYGSHVLRSSSRLGAVLGIESRSPGCGGGCTRRLGGGSPALHLLSGSELLLAGARLLVGPGVQDTDDAISPLCEHLPYFATAPPSPR